MADTREDALAVLSAALIDKYTDYIRVIDTSAGESKIMLVDDFMDSLGIGSTAGGVSTFIALTDTDPTTYTGQVRKIIRVNAAETGLEFTAFVRIVTLTDSATVTPNADTTDQGLLLTLSQATTFANPTGTPLDGQKLMLRIKSTVSRAYTWGSQYRGSTDLALPTATTGGSLTDYLGFIYNSADTKWDYVAKTNGF